MRLGILSDTHGLLRPEVLPALRGADHILHAGDVGDPAILDQLRTLAPVTAIRGNIDRSGPCAALPATEALDLAGVLVYMLHALDDLDLQPQAAGIGLLVYGHSHKPSVDQRGSTLFLNPGSAGPRRFRLPITLAIVEISPAATLAAEIIPLLS